MSDGISLAYLGLEQVGTLYRNAAVPVLIEETIKRGQGVLSTSGALIVRTGARTGRSPNDKFFVRRAPSSEEIHWGKINRAVTPDVFDRVFDKVRNYLKNRDLFIFDGFVGADLAYRLPMRVISPIPWHGLFSETLFVRPSPEDLADVTPEFTLVNAAECFLDGERDGINSEAFIAADFERKLILVSGSGYAGEIKKSFFTVMNYLLPLRGVMTMHCSANVGEDDRVALFFGLSGTGKTTLSADPARRLIGDDEHGWTDDGIFNFEGGCYAKCINLSEKAEPQIYRAIRFGSVVENVDYDPVRRAIDYDSDRITENTRATYPVHHIPGALESGRGGHPSDIFFLAADAFGVLPPIARLDVPHAMYHFLSGYTAKLAGTESGVTEPQATFSACFGEPFMPLHPARYAALLGQRIVEHGARVWLVNTGWTGGPYGVGKRMSIQHTRRLLNAALNRELDDVPTRTDATFGLQVPLHCPGVPDEVLDPRRTWPNPVEYDIKARELASRFVQNFAKYADGASEEIRQAGPKVG